MEKAVSYRWGLIALCALSAAMGSAMPATAQTVTGQARAVKSIVAGTTTAIVDTGTLSVPDDAREKSAATGSVSALLTAETLHATAITWSDQVASEASLAKLTVSVNGTTIGADFVMARASAVVGFGSTRIASIEGFSINGLPVTVTGLPNQTISIPGGQVVINEQTSGTVNALHIAVSGVADIVVASATASVP